MTATFDRLRALFQAHPASVGESYGAHLMIALSFGIRLIGAGLACCVHAVLPFVFVRTGSQTIHRLYADMVTHRRRTELPGGVLPDYQI